MTCCDRVAIVPARGGSKGIPNKNLSQIGGRTLVAWTIEAAQQCEKISGIYLTTDSDLIAEEGKRAGATIIYRPEELAQDQTPTEPVVIHALEWISTNDGKKPKEFVLLQLTSPFRTSGDINNACEMFDGEGSVVSVSLPHKHPLKSFYQNSDHTLRPLVDEQTLGQPRQHLPVVVQPNGAIYLTSTNSFLKTKSLYTPPVRGLLMDRKSSIDIDDQFDLELARMIYREKP